MQYTDAVNMKRGIIMDDKNPAGSSSSPDKSKHMKEEAIDVFKYFGSANIRNRDAFAELLDYTMENRRNPNNGKA